MKGVAWIWGNDLRLFRIGASWTLADILVTNSRPTSVSILGRIYPRNSAVVRGHAVDISESGISAMLRVEVPIGEVVRLEFSSPTGDVNVHALVRQRSAFRYGFQFVEASSAQDVIGRTCRQLAVEQAIFDPPQR